MTFDEQCELHRRHAIIISDSQVARDFHADTMPPVLTIIDETCPMTPELIDRTLRDAEKKEPQP